MGMSAITKPIPVRVQEGMARIDATARKLKTTRGKIIVFAAFAFVEFAEKNKVVTMPPDWVAVLKQKRK